MQFMSKMTRIKSWIRRLLCGGKIAVAQFLFVYGLGKGFRYGNNEDFWDSWHFIIVYFIINITMIIKTNLI